MSEKPLNDMELQMTPLHQRLSYGSIQIIEEDLKEGGAGSRTCQNNPDSFFTNIGGGGTGGIINLGMIDTDEALPDSISNVVETKKQIHNAKASPEETMVMIIQ